MVENKAVAVAHPASSILVVRDMDQRLEVLMIERAKSLRFAPGAFVFPGGKVDPADHNLALWQGLTNAVDGMTDFAFRLAALRELYEEAGLLLTLGQSKILDPGLDFRAGLLAKGSQLNLAGMEPFAHWVTPEGMPRRFDTHFYITPHNGQDVRHDGYEAVSFRWVCPKETLKEWDLDHIPLMFPTRLNLMKLARASNVAEALAQARETTVVRTLPVIGRDKNGIKLTIDPASGYEITQASFKELHVESAK